MRCLHSVLLLVKKQEWARCQQLIFAADFSKNSFTFPCSLYVLIVNIAFVVFLVYLLTDVLNLSGNQLLHCEKNRASMWQLTAVGLKFK